MGLVVTSRKFFYENKNGSDFSLNTGDFTNFLRPLAGELCKAVYEFEITNFISVNPITNEHSFIITNISGDDYALDLLGGGDWNNYKEGFIFDVFDNVGAALVVTTGTVTTIIGNTLFFNSTTVTTGTYVDADAKTKQEWTDFNFFYRHFGNDFNSPIDGSPQQYHADLGSPQSTTLVTGDALGSGAWQNGSFKTKFVSTPDGGFTQLFTFEHIFEILPYFESGQIADITNVNTVIPYKDGIINYDFKLEAFNIANTTSIFTNEVTQLGQVTWWNKAKSNLPTSYSLTSITYTDTVTSKILTKITTENKVQVVVVIADDGAAPFVASDPFTVKHSFLPEDYTDNTTQLFDAIWLNENLRSTLGAGAAAGTIITNLTGVRDSAVQITITFDIEFTTSQKLQIEDGFNYLLAIQLEDSTKNNLNTNSTPLILDVNNYTVNTDIDGIISETSSLYFKHTNDIGTGGTTDYDGTIEDGVVGVIGFTIAPSTKEVILNNLAFIIVAFDTVNNVWFEIQRNDIGIPQNIFVKDSGTGKQLQQIQIDTTRGFSLKAGNQFNFKKITTGLFINPNQPYTLTFGFKINWEAFEALQGASTDFFDSTKENNGLNLNTSNYSGAFNRQIRFAREYIYTVNGIQTTKIIFSPDSDINDYGESDDNWTAIINTENAAGFDLEEKFQNKADTTIVATFSDTTTQTTIDDFEAEIIIKEKNSSDFFPISTKRDVLAGGLLKPITGTTASKSIIAGDFVVKCLLDFTKLANPNYSISARLYKSIFPNIFSMLFDGTNEKLKAGINASLNFEWTDPFSVSFLFNSVNVLAVNKTIFRRSDAGVGYVVFMNNGGVEFQLRGGGGNISRRFNITSPGFQDNTWYHAVVRWDGGGTQAAATCVVNGALTTSNLPVLSDNFSGGDSMLSSSTTVLGNNLAGTVGFNGNLDEEAVFDKVLTVAECAEAAPLLCGADLINDYSASANLKAWYRMGEGGVFSGGNWTIPDETGGTSAVSEFMEEADREAFVGC